MVDKVITDNADFIAAWNKKKKEQESLQRRAYNRIKKMCTFPSK